MPRPLNAPVAHRGTGRQTIFGGPSQRAQLVKKELSSSERSDQQNIFVIIEGTLSPSTLTTHTKIEALDRARSKNAGGWPTLPARELTVSSHHACSISSPESSISDASLFSLLSSVLLRAAAHSKERGAACTLAGVCRLRSSCVQRASQ